MSAKHTPGPWLRKGVLVFSLTPYTGNSEYLRKKLPDGVNRFSAYVSNDNSAATDEEIDSNAQLIAAAPDLLAALKGVVSVADRDTAEFKAARKAIAKAEGKEAAQ